MIIKCPEYIDSAFRLLEQSGFKAYAVGGCVRDFLLGKTPDDWDMTTSSTPEETMEVFKNFRVIPTGIKHGTVTVIINGKPIEITTMRIDGEYHDSRRPDNVQFTSDIEKDLSRRDFTVNAMAYNHTDGIIDTFSGQKDLKNNIIRCVGNPDKRFNEDALRIIRALRFSCVLNFDIEKETAESIIKNVSLINNVANERIRIELVKLLQGTAVERILTNYKDVIFTIIPQLRYLDGFAQNTPYHIYDIWEHTVKVIANVKNTPELRIAALLHDIGKPECFTTDKDGIAHFKGHPELSAEMAVDIMKNLRFSNKETETVYNIIKLHDTYPDGNRTTVAKYCSKYSPEILKLTLELMRGDTAGKSPAFRDIQYASYNLAEKQINEIIESNLCLRLSDLAVNGKDIRELGFTGKDIGNVLNTLLSMIIEEKIPNEKAVLITSATKLKNN